MLAAQGRSEEARAHLATAVELEPRWGEALYELAHLCRARGETDRANELLDRYRVARASPASRDPFLEGSRRSSATPTTSSGRPTAV
jgi:hypothetical protein